VHCASWMSLDVMQMRSFSRRSAEMLFCDQGTVTCSQTSYDFSDIASFRVLLEIRHAVQRRVMTRLQLINSYFCDLLIKFHL